MRIYNLPELARVLRVLRARIPSDSLCVRLGDEEIRMLQ
jgi:hypothetical protein